MNNLLVLYLTIILSFVGGDTYWKRRNMKQKTLWDLFKESLNTKPNEVSPFDRTHNTFMNILKFRIFGTRPIYDNVEDILALEHGISRIKKKHGENTPITVIRGLVHRDTQVVAFFVDGKILYNQTWLSAPGMEWYGSKKTLGMFLISLIFDRLKFLECGAFYR